MLLYLRFNFKICIKTQVLVIIFKIVFKFIKFTLNYCIINVSIVNFNISFVLKMFKNFIKICILQQSVYSVNMFLKLLIQLSMPHL